MRNDVLNQVCDTLPRWLTEIPEFKVFRSVVKAVAVFVMH